MTPRETVIRVNVRPGWQQRTLLPLHSPALDARMRMQAELALAQYNVPSVEVLATCGSDSVLLVAERYVVFRTVEDAAWPSWA